jgi:hypothetical protein
MRILRGVQKVTLYYIVLSFKCVERELLHENYAKQDPEALVKHIKNEV